MSEKRLKRKSNWYIYVITFIITLFALILVVLALWDVIFPPKAETGVNTSGISDVRPSAAYNTTFLIMLTESKGGVPDYYMLANYRPRDDALVLVELDKRLYAKVGTTDGTLNDIYSKGGAERVCRAIEGVFGFSPERYIKFDKQSLIELIDMVGTTTVNVPYDLEIFGEVVFAAGTHQMDGEMVYDYITFDRFSEGEGEEENTPNTSTMSTLTLVAKTFVNENSRNKTSTDLQAIARKVINTADTNYTFDDFTTNQSAYTYTTEKSFNIAEDYLPLYIVDGDGRFAIAESSLQTIKSRFNMEYVTSSD